MRDFDNCEICGEDDWGVVHDGDIRNGAFENQNANGMVAQCHSCGVQRLAERYCPSAGIYETDEYRSKLKTGLDSQSYFITHDEFQVFSHQAMWPLHFRGLNIADVGCAGGSFLDTVRGQANKVVGIEPFSEYHPSLRARDIQTYPYVADACVDHAWQVDLATSFQVIEHVENPLAFLSEIKRLLKPNGSVVLSTPNRDDVLMQLLPDAFPSFFYRVVHRWYFDADSISQVASRAGFDVVDVKHIHRYGMSNALSWLRDRMPTGHKKLDGITPMADNLWKSYLENTGQSDTIYIFLVNR